MVVVTHGGVTTDALRTLVGDHALAGERPGLLADGVPNGAITTLSVGDGVVTVVDLPTTAHLR